MEIYYVSDVYADNVEFVDEQTFYAKREDAETELAERIAHLQVTEDKRHEKSVTSWQTDREAVKAIVDAGLLVPYSLAWVPSTPPEKWPVTHSLAVIAVEVIE